MFIDIQGTYYNLNLVSSINLDDEKQIIELYCNNVYITHELNDYEREVSILPRLIKKLGR